MPIKYSHAGRLNGLEAYWFTLAADAFDNDIDDTKSSCYCTDNKCLRKGLGNITPCYYSKSKFGLDIEIIYKLFAIFYHFKFVVYNCWLCLVYILSAYINLF